MYTRHLLVVSFWSETPGLKNNINVIVKISCAYAYVLVWVFVPLCVCERERERDREREREREQGTAFTHCCLSWLWIGDIWCIQVWISRRFMYDGSPESHLWTTLLVRSCLSTELKCCTRPFFKETTHKSKLVHGWSEKIMDLSALTYWHISNAKP